MTSEHPTTGAAPAEAAFLPRDPAFAERVRASFAAQPFMATLGARLDLVAPGRVAIVLTVAPSLHQQHGYLHGGALMAVADSAAGYAAMTLMAAGDGVLTADIKLNLLRPATGPAVRAVGEVVRAGRNLTVVRAEVHGGAEGQGAHLATAIFGMMRVEGAG